MRNLNKSLQDTPTEVQTVAAIRIPAFLIDFTAVIAVIVALITILKSIGFAPEQFPIGYVMFLLIPLGLFLYWSLNINLGKRLFKLEVIDEKSGGSPSLKQLFIRCLLFSLLVSLNVSFLIPIFVSKKHRAFHDMMAGTLVVRRTT
ncbi:RDD family protein [Corallincola platygyrae]|uniref:RDD family protein n=1 Tax=Corallincola platygyrae TaxID=1193278 RepID=A0ABW4XFX0_9GAMM